MTARLKGVQPQLKIVHVARILEREYRGYDHGNKKNPLNELVFILLTLLFEQNLDFNIRLFESFPINTAEAILGILFTLAISKQIELRSTRLTSVLKYIGQASLFILIFHVPIQEFWAQKFCW